MGSLGSSRRAGGGRSLSLVHGAFIAPMSCGPPATRSSGATDVFASDMDVTGSTQCDAGTDSLTNSEFFDRHKVMCPTGSALAEWKVARCSDETKLQVNYKCRSAGDHLAAAEEVTSQCQHLRGEKLQFFDRQDPGCPSDKVMVGFQLEQGTCTGSDMRLRTWCSSLVTTTTSTEPARSDTEGDPPADLVTTTTSTEPARSDTGGDPPADLLTDSGGKALLNSECAKYRDQASSKSAVDQKKIMAKCMQQVSRGSDF